MFCPGGGLVLPFPLYSTWAAVFHLLKRFTTIVFSRDFLNSFDSMLEDFVISPNVSSVVPFVLCYGFFIDKFLGFLYSRLLLQTVSENEVFV